ncbi:FAD-dependent pyridine nucleotide-disulfide oxidoreductase OS=Tsukamurella paurometabola (strain ATCC 8368 / DSM / CCUG 35730 / CIP 100753 / JCM 10117 /KCTC 9821 / NBRC 16120 / NCIMB 702349 / NCTC 13040) OX=521096 GN=Tpau_0105 PE=4 SV=1 [Tsukamurella paurometabola]|uniref:FAD-dependent pyridine nucleotide-disulfide oxidoreductase n=1 Tax=Tsukamurella paurometabola (strain ATCC 8368 / DSM 20162 / CCUG 35730 / CIP 100753 / JCM 10117 / KCTC 9821 / NBRC 16120 / NCIMB 702349 / NCTC 13040) TaxID=521096 RepID=D5UPZ1_TSUPD|nr:FAD-dependent oxidoreductase [Tsukamurella paurometabola]ADG76759.1 FAD-dependent pyridine nucleotide-disulfide oxidoreductase [Tsukamurella paurometabola DSM 20162]SUP41504.1 Sulfide dehydrogenase [flavocytochrome c] flavoprotein chain precursor [Tsukamurella paurometabola]
MGNKRIVIAGAGIGGLSVIKELRESGVALDGVEITLIDENFEHYLGFTLPWVMRGWRTADSIPIRPSEAALKDIRAVRATIAGVDGPGKTVLLDNGDRVGFDALVMALGARNATNRVPGLQEAADTGVAVHYYATADAARAHRALTDFPGGRLVFLVAAMPFRCPVAPYEGAFLAADLLAERGVREETEIAVYTPEPQPMPSAGPHVGLELAERVRAAGIALHPLHQVERVDPATKIVHFADGASVPFDLLVFVPPHEAAVPLDGPGWIPVDRESMSTGQDGIWAIGDLSAVTSPTDRPLPKAAIFAKNGAAAVARNLLQYLGLESAGAHLSGRGYCYIDTGAHESARGSGDFFAEPHPDVTLTPASAALHQDKVQEERDWRAYWE